MYQMGSALASCIVTVPSVPYITSIERQIVKQSWHRLNDRNPSICEAILHEAMAKSPRVCLALGVTDNLLASRQLDMRLRKQADRLHRFLDEIINEKRLLRGQVTSACEQLGMQQVANGKLSLTMIGIFLSLLITQLEQEEFSIQSRPVSGKEVAIAWKRLSSFILSSVTDGVDHNHRWRKLSQYNDLDY